MVDTREPLVSVVIPTWRRPQRVLQALRTALDQTWSRLEVLVVDDASGDDTEDAVRSVGDPRVRYLEHDRNRGASAARNTGLRAATGSMVSFLDSDDEWLPRKIERQVAAFDAAPDDTSLVYCSIVFVRPDGSESVREAATPDDPYRVLLARNFVGGASVPLMSRELLLDVGGFDEDLPSNQDHDLWIRLARRGPMVAIPEPLARLHVGEVGNRISTDAEARREGTRRMYAKHRDELLAHGMEQPFWSSNGRFLLSVVGDAAGARDCFLAGIRARPTAPRPYLEVAATFVPRTVFRLLSDPTWRRAP